MLQIFNILTVVTFIILKWKQL